MKALKMTPRITCSLLTAVFCFLISQASGQAKAPKSLAPYLEPDKNYVGERGVVVPPEEIKKYYKLVKIGAQKNPEWYDEYSKLTKPGVPLPFHENLNLTPEEYKEYRALWDKREFKVLEKMGIRLEKAGKQWRFLTSGQDTRIPLLLFDGEADVFKSINGDLERITDIEAPADNILGAWKGAEWRFEEETPIDRTKENFAIGKSADGKFVFIIHRLWEITSTGSVLLDENQIIRIALK